jgi:ABC-type phosphate/phosphonate transport system substrate-binding protein
MENSRYVMGVFPHLPITDLERIYSPMAADLASGLNKEVFFQSKATFEDFKMELDAETYDIVVVQPFDYIYIADNHNYVPLARRGEPLEGVFVTLQDSNIRTPKDLAGKRIALPPKGAAVSRLAIDLLLENNIATSNVKLSFHRSHINCMQQLLIKQADVCVTAEPMLRFFNHKRKTNLQFVFKTKSIPHVLFAAHKRVPEKYRQHAMNIITTWDDIEEKKQLLTNGKFPPFVPATDSEYDIVRHLLKDK